MSADVTKIELAKALRAIKAISTDEQFEKVKQIYIHDEGEESVMNSVNGLSEEDEFALLTKLMGTASHIVGFEQRPLVEGKYIVADYFLTLKPGFTLGNKPKSKFSEFKCLVDVKSTEKDLFKIGGSKLQKLRNFADLFNLRLFFAIRFLRIKQSALWAIVEDADRTSTYLHADYGNIVKGFRHIFWDEYTLSLHPNLSLICKFSKSSTIDSVSHEIFGKQIEATITNGVDTVILDADVSFISCAFLEAYDLVESKVEVINTDVTLQYLKPSLSTVFLADIIFKLNSLPVDEHGNIMYDASKLIVRSDTGVHSKLADRSLIDKIAKFFLRNKFLFRGSVGDQKENYELWKSLGGSD